MVKPVDIINYWYSDELKKHWFSSTPALDNEITNYYEQLWEDAANGKLDEWMTTPDGCLALIIILDQFPLNMFRGQAKSFQTEGKAIEVSLAAVSRGFDKQLSTDKLAFLFMPLMHSEKLENQALSVRLFAQYNLADNLKFAKHHQDIVQRFGRFPHRNKILGRESTSAEIEYLNSKEAFKG